MASFTASPDIDNPYVLEGKMVVREGDVLAHTLSWPFWSSVSTAGTNVYLNGSSQSAGTWLGGTSVVSGNVTTLSSLTIPAGLGGSTVVIEVGGTNGGETRKMGIIHIILKPGDSP
jgi:hypothetical protein